MALRETLGAKLAPIFFRLALGATFIYAGHGKLFVKVPCTPDQLAVLANMGVSGAVTAVRPAAAPTNGAPTQTTPPPSTPRTNEPANPLPEPTKPAGHPGGALASTSTVTGRTFTPADFESNADLPMLYQVAITLHNYSTDPAVRADGSKPMRLWPSSLGQGTWPVRLAWAVVLTEFVGGCLVLIGFLSRLAALGLAGVMLGALWLATIGPAIHAPTSFLGFLPKLSSFEGWHSFMLQLCALACAVGVACIGAGWLSVDGFVFGSSRSGSRGGDGGGGDDE